MADPQNPYAQYAQSPVQFQSPEVAPNVAHTGAETQQITATLPSTVAKSQADAIKAAAEASQAAAQQAAATRQKQAEASSAQYKANADNIIANRMQQQKASMADNIQSVVQATQHARQILQDNPWLTTGNAYEITRHLHGSPASQLESIIDGQLNGALFSQRMGQYREEGGTNPNGSGSPPRIIKSEVGLIKNAMGTLDPGDLGYQGTLDALQSIEHFAKRSGAIINGDNPDDPNVQAKYAIPTLPQYGGGQLATIPANAPQDNGITRSNQLPTITGNNAAQITQNSGQQTKDAIDPVLQLRGQIIGKMIANGVPDSKILNYVQQNGIANSNIDQILQYRHTKDFQTWKQQNPNSSYPLGPSFYTRQVPMGAAQQMFNKAASTDIGGAAAAAPVAAANAISGDRLGSLAGPDAQLSMQLMRQEHPLASMAGDAAGQAAVQSLLPIPGSGTLANVGKDILYGAYSGSGDNGPGTMSGAVLGAGAGLLGRGAQTALGGALKGVSNASLGYLNSQGVPLTIGQIGRGSTNVVGRAVGGIEDRLAGLPGFDAVINAGRRRGDEAFNEAAFKQAGGSGATGATGLAELNNLRNNAYSFLDGTQIPVDPQFTEAQNAVRATLPNMTGDHAAGVGGVLNNIDNTVQNGVMTGRDWQSNLRGVRGAQSSISGTPYSDIPNAALNNADDNLVDLAARNGPSGTIDNLASANQLHANTETLLNAVGKPGAQRDDGLFSPTMLNSSSIAGARKYQGAMAALTGNRPFYDLTNAGMDVMPNLTPDSGTAGRLAVLGALAGIGTGIGAGVGAADGEDAGEGAEKGGEKGLGYGLTLGALAMGPYSKAGQRFLQATLLGARPQVVSKLGGMLVNNPAVGGALAQALARNNAYSLGDLARMNQLTNFAN